MRFLRDLQVGEGNKRLMEKKRSEEETKSESEQVY